MSEDGYEFFAKRQLVTLFSAPNFCGEYDNAAAIMTVDETLMCSFQVNITPRNSSTLHLQILKPVDKKKFSYQMAQIETNVAVPIAAHGGSLPMTSLSNPRPRLCHLTKANMTDDFGFNLHVERGPVFAKYFTFYFTR